MTTIDAAIDDYLHTIVRTRPWSKKREEALLEDFSAWLREQPEPPVAVDEIEPALAHRYAAATSLDAAVHAELLAALHNLYTWQVHTQVVNRNPFAQT